MEHLIDFWVTVSYDMEKAMAPHSSTLAWRIPWMEKPGGLQSMGSQRVGHDGATLLHSLAFWAKRKFWVISERESEVAQSCPTLCNPMDCSPPGSSVHGILQARVLEWVAISFSRGSSRPRDRTQVSHIAGRCFNLWATREARKKKGCIN